MRTFLIILDSFGIGGAADADKFGDGGANTLLSVSRSDKLNIPTLRRLGLFNIDGVSAGTPTENPEASYARLCERSAGKDTTIGHWEISGIVSDKPLPTYPDGFPPEIISEFERLTGRRAIVNRPYSGTDVIRDYGEEHIKTGALIVYTSADSVFQIAAHEDIVPTETLYEYCKTARGILTGENGVGRVIARPFTGVPGSFVRTAGRHDFSLAPPAPTMLDRLSEAGRDVIAVGKINDIFASRGITRAVATKGNADGMVKTMLEAKRGFDGLCFVNLVDFDMLYGHRNDTDGYANALSEFDSRLSGFIPLLLPGDRLFITADHGCDPEFPGTDHTRENVPLLILGGEKRNLGIINGFDFVAREILRGFGLDM